MNTIDHIYSHYIGPYIFFYLTALYLGLESAFSLNKRQKLLGEEIRQNVGWILINNFLIEYLILGLLFILRASLIPLLWLKYVSEHLTVFQGFRFPIENTLLLIMVIFISRDFLQWSIHRALHANRFLWKFHMLHHSSRHIDALAGFRTNWLENLLIDSVLAIPMIVFQVPPEGFALVGLLELHLSFFIHSNVNIKDKWLWKFFVSPLTHHWHHAEYCHFRTGQNFGGYSTLFDRLFGTYYCPAEAPERYGIKEPGNYPENFIARFFYPFVPSRLLPVTSAPRKDAAKTQLLS